MADGEQTSTPGSAPKYRRVLVKFSGEALMGNADYGISPEVLRTTSRELIALRGAGVEVAVVVGGGNIFRGAGLASGGSKRTPP